MADTLIKSTTRHIRLFTARVEDGQLVADASQLTMDVDPDNEFLWDAPVLAKVQDHFRELVAAQAGADLTEYNLRQIGSQLEKLQQRFRDLVASHAGADLTDYTLRRIGSDLEGTVRQLLQAGELRYNPDARVLNYSMGLPRSPEQEQA